MARRLSNDGSDDRDAYARMQMYNDSRRATATQQRAVGDWSVEGGRGGIASSSRNMSNQGSLRDMWRNGKIVQPGTSAQAPAATQSQNPLNPAKTSTATPASGYDPSMSGEDYGSVRQGYSSVGAGSKLFGSEASRAAGALTRSGESVWFNTGQPAPGEDRIDSALNQSIFKNTVGDRKGILTSGAGVGALFGQSALPAGNYYIPGTTVTRPSGLSITVGGERASLPSPRVPAAAPSNKASGYRWASADVEKQFPPIDMAPYQARTRTERTNNEREYNRFMQLSEASMGSERLQSLYSGAF